MADKSLATEVMAEFTELKSRRKPLEEKWLQYFKVMHMYKEYTSAQQRLIQLGIKSDIRIPRVFSHIETKRPRILNNIFSFDPLALCIPEDDSSADVFALLQKAVNKQLKEKLYIPMYHAVTQALYMGTSWISMDWEIKSQAGQVIEGLGFDFNDTFNVYVPDTALSMKEVNKLYVFTKKRKSWFEKQNAGKNGTKFQNINQLKPAEKSNSEYDNTMYYDRLNVLGITGGTSNYDTTAYGAGSQEAAGDGGDPEDFLVDYAVRWEPDRVVGIGNGEVVMRDSEHMFTGIIPFYPLRDYLSDVMFYGIGEVQLLAGIPDYLDEIKNMRVDIIRRVAYPAALVSRNARIPQEDLVVRPNQIIRTYDMDGYKEINRPDVKRILLEEEVMGKEDAQDSTGIWNLLKGGDLPRSETATTGIMMKESGMERINSMVFLICKECLEPLCADAATVLQENLEAGFWLNISDKDQPVQMKKVVGEDIKALASWQIPAFNVRSIVDITLQQNFNTMYDKLIASPNINSFELDKKYCEIYDLKNVPELLIQGVEKQAIELIRNNETFGALVQAIALNPEALNSISLPPPPEGTVTNEGGINTGQPIGAGMAAPGNMVPETNGGVTEGITGNGGVNVV